MHGPLEPPVRLTQCLPEPEVRQPPILPSFFVGALAIRVGALAIRSHLEAEITQLFQHQSEAGIETPLARSVTGHGHTLASRTTHFNCAARDTYNGHHCWPSPGGTTMKLGLYLGYSGATMTLPVDKVQLAERLGY